MRQILLTTDIVGTRIRNKSLANNTGHLVGTTSRIGSGLAGTGIDGQSAQTTQSNDQG